MNTLLLQDICESTGWHVVVAEDGRLGLAEARKRRPDVIVLDLMMPRMDGFGVLTVLRQDPEVSWIPVLVVTALSGEESRDRALELGAWDYLRKPFSVAELTKRMGVALGLSAERRETEKERDG